MTLPTIHLNGTSGKELCDGYEAAHTAINAAIESLAETHPNGRDYYPQGPDAFTVARDEHFDRISRLQAVMSEVEELMMHAYGEKR